MAKLIDGILELALSEHGARTRIANASARLKEDLYASFRTHRRRMLTETVDKFLTYLAELSAEGMRTRPETMRSGAEVSLADVLAHATMDDLIEWAAEREVTRLTNRGLPALAEFFDRRFGLSLSPDEERATLLRYATLVRNLYTHRRGVVDRRFLTAAAEFRLADGLAVGELWTAPTDFFLDVVAAALDSVMHLDSLAIEKFALETVSGPHGQGCRGCLMFRLADESGGGPGHQMS